MSFASLEDLTYFSLAGFTLNQEEKAVLSSSLQVKKDQEKLATISFWGKVQALQRDYLIAQATGDSLFDRKYFYSVDLVNWLQLPDVSAAEAARIDHQLKGKFHGDPLKEYFVVKEANDPDLRPEEKIIKEEKRLARVICAINEEAQIVPRGAYFVGSTNKLELNPNFTGISKENLTNLKHYLHFKAGYKPDTATMKEDVHSFDPSIDVFEPISNDEPKGCWSVQGERGGSVAILRSLQWPGYTFYYAPSNGHKFGAVYFGSGQKNEHLGYAL